jgi:hypothetical protein
MCRNNPAIEIPSEAFWVLVELNVGKLPYTAKLYGSTSENFEKASQILLNNNFIKLDSDQFSKRQSYIIDTLGKKFLDEQQYYIVNMPIDRLCNHPCNTLFAYETLLFQLNDNLGMNVEKWASYYLGLINFSLKQISPRGQAWLEYCAKKWSVELLKLIPIQTQDNLEIVDQLLKFLVPKVDPQTWPHVLTCLEPSQAQAAARILRGLNG